jgi:hypothetical protein
MANNIVTRLPNGLNDNAPDSWNADLVGLNPTRYFSVWDDFTYSLDAVTDATFTWGSVDDSGTGTNAFQDAMGGVYNVVTAASDNDYHAMVGQQKIFKFVAGKKLWFEARVKVNEATVLESTWWVGLTDTTTTGGMQANAAGPLASYDGALIWKTPETAMTLNFETSNAGTQNTLSAFATSVSNTWTRVAFYFDGTATTSTITPYVAVNGSDTFVSGTPQNITLAGLDEMKMVFGIKAGPTAAAETLQIDYIMCVQERI